jgi:hypothetical protein
MVLSRNRFFLVLFLIFIGPSIAYKVIWIATAQRTNGRVLFRGRSIETQGTSDHSVIKYKADRDSLIFNTSDDLEMDKGEIVAVLYQKGDPASACVNNFAGLWLGTAVYMLFPFLIIVVLYFTPDKFDPLIPKNARIVLGKKPIIQIIS